MKSKQFVLAGRALLALDVLLIGALEFWRLQVSTGTPRSLQRGLFGVVVGLVILLWALRKHRNQEWQPTKMGMIIWMVVGMLCVLSILGLVLPIALSSAG